MVKGWQPAVSGLMFRTVRLCHTQARKQPCTTLFPSVTTTRYPPEARLVMVDEGTLFSVESTFHELVAWL